MPSFKTDDDRRTKLRAAAARVRESMSPEFKQMSADEIMRFVRGEDGAFSEKAGSNSSGDAFPKPANSETDE
jgi:hypothetical protein